MPACIAAFTLACVGGVLSTQPGMGGPFTMLAFAVVGPLLAALMARDHALIVAFLHNVLLCAFTLTVGSTFHGSWQPLDELGITFLILLLITAVPSVLIGGAVTVFSMMRSRHLLHATAHAGDR
jgi:hypothetical protein